VGSDGHGQARSRAVGSRPGHAVEATAPFRTLTSAAPWSPRRP